MDEDRFETLLTGIVELKLDPTTMGDRQSSSRENEEVPPFEDPLDFLNLQACDTKNRVRDVVKKNKTSHTIKSWRKDD